MNTRGDNIFDTIYDLCIIGGGINGVGIARDAAGRGLSVLLVEKDDLAQGTSSRSGKLVHGGLRYLEHYDFRLVREALIEREVLLEMAPHIIWPMRFVLPHSAEDRPAWLIRAGLFLYDHLGGRKRLPATRTLNLRNCPEGEAIKPQYKKAFEYSDCWVDDARLVVLNALDAAERGATIKSQTTFMHAKRMDNHWRIGIQATGTSTSTIDSISAKCLVNAAGPWVNSVIENVESTRTKRRVRLVKGSHIVLKKFWSGEQAYLVQNSDKRVIFINPYENGNALIGTTDISFEGDPASVQIDDAEIDYLLAAVNRYFNREQKRGDIVQSFSGVRALYDDNTENPSDVTRDYLFDIDAGSNGAPLLSVFGGKITTYRKLAEHALDKLSGTFPEMGRRWTSGSSLPGGDMEGAKFKNFLNQLSQQFQNLPADLIQHYGRLYGTRSLGLLDGVLDTDDLGRKFGEHFYEIEARYLVNNEWARCPADILTRRTKHGLHMSSVEVSAFESWFETSFARTSPALQ